MKRISTMIVSLIMGTIAVFGCIGCSESDNLSKPNVTAEQIDALQQQINALEQGSTAQQNKINALETELALLKGSVQTPKESYNLGETVTYVCNGVKIFDFTLVDVYKTANLSTYADYRFQEYSNIIKNEYLSQYVRFSIHDITTPAFYRNPHNAVSFDVTSGTMEFGVGGTGDTTFCLSFACGPSWTIFAKYNINLQVRV